MPAAEVLPFSTGVILEPLPLDRLVAGLPAAIANLGPDHWFSAAHGIMTTDTLPKVHSSKVGSAARPSPSPASARAPA